MIENIPIDDAAIRDGFVHNLLIVIGAITAAEMNKNGRQMVFNTLIELMAYLQNPSSVTEVTPVAPMNMYQ